ncbi:hypothetical protein GCM10023310_69800 [Paenibacillus vulneris]|uniref:Uncharacterized protein n=1 Tax=Paenibacillus vulneris TaxID=1133364 RepID=A0ABW3UG91_9BACL
MFTFMLYINFLWKDAHTRAGVSLIKSISVPIIYNGNIIGETRASVERLDNGTYRVIIGVCADVIVHGNQRRGKGATKYKDDIMKAVELYKNLVQ